MLKYKVSSLILVIVLITIFLVLVKFLLERLFVNFLDKISKENKISKEEFINAYKINSEHLIERIKDLSDSSNKFELRVISNFESFSNRIIDSFSTFNKGIEEKINILNSLISDNSFKNREELSKSLFSFKDSINSSIIEISKVQQKQLSDFSNQLSHLIDSNKLNLDKMRDSIQIQLSSLQSDNNKELEKMREVVNEKLHSTLEKRLGDSFKIVSDRLEIVHKGLGEMQTLASGVGDLKKILTNVKTRGTWGEIQLENILNQILTAEQFEKNFAVNKNSAERVEFAIKIPHNDREFIFLPIDSKFPLEDYHRFSNLEDGQDGNDLLKQLEARIKFEAKTIKEKYIKPPITTDFAILFLPTEGLYSEIVKRPGLFETLQNEYRVIVAGPWTLAAILNSLRIGFRTLAIEKRTGEVWKLLGDIKGEFTKFGDLLDKTHKKLAEASDAIEGASKRSRKIEKKLENVELLPAQEILVEFNEPMDGVN